MSRTKYDSDKESTSNKSHHQRQGIRSEFLPPEQEHPREYYPNVANASSFLHERYGTNEEVHQERKRVFTPSRTVFSTAHQVLNF